MVRRLLTVPICGRGDGDLWWNHGGVSGAVREWVARLAVYGFAGQGQSPYGTLPLYGEVNGMLRFDHRCFHARRVQLLPTACTGIYKDGHRVCAISDGGTASCNASPGPDYGCVPNGRRSLRVDRRHASPRHCARVLREERGLGDVA